MKELQIKEYRCKICQKLKKGVHFKSYNLKICLDCFLNFFRKRVKETIERFEMFDLKEKIAVAVSGGKDSIALARILKDLGYNIVLFHINTGIKKNNYAQESQKKVEEFAQRENLELKIFSLEEEIQTDIVSASKIFKREICATCGLIKRYLLNREAQNFDVIVTGHTLNDEAASLLSSLVFWKDEYLKKQWPLLKEEEGKKLKRRAKPLTLCFEQETKLFCEILNLPFIEKACPLRGGPYLIFKELINQLEETMPSSVLNFYKGYLKRKKDLFPFNSSFNKTFFCKICGFSTLSDICNFCRLKEKIKEKNLKTI